MLRARASDIASKVWSRLGLALVFVFLSVMMAFPEISKLDTHTPGDYGDGYLVQWILKWNAHASLTGLENLFDANIFWPRNETLAYADTLLPAFPIVLLLTVVFGDPAGFNLTYLATWVASLASMYLLAIWFTGKRAASLLAAIVFTFSAYRLVHHLHFQLSFAFLLPLVFYLLFRFLDEQRWWQAVCLGLGIGMSGLAAAYYGAILAVLIPIVVAGWVVASRSGPPMRMVAGLAVAAAVALTLVIPVALAYRQAHQDPGYRPDTTDQFSAEARDFLAPAAGSYLHRGLDRLANRYRLGPEHRLFPGFAATALALAGLVMIPTRRRGTPLLSHPRPRALAVLLVGGAVAFVLSLGTTGCLVGRCLPLPFRLLADHVIGFDGLRATGRFFVVPLLSLSVLVAVGHAILTAGRSFRVTAVTAGLLGALMLGEYAAPITIVEDIRAPGATAVNARLDVLPPGPVVELPMADPKTPAWGFVESPRMFLSTIDWNPRVNGYSGFIPDGYRQTALVMNMLATGEPAGEIVIDLLNRLNVRYIVLRTAPIGRLAPGDPILAPGLAYYREEELQRVIRALPPEIVRRTGRHGDAVLIELGR